MSNRSQLLHGIRQYRSLIEELLLDLQSHRRLPVSRQRYYSKALQNFSQKIEKVKTPAQNSKKAPCFGKSRSSLR